MNASSDENNSEALEAEIQAGRRVRSVHDIKASLAIASGFSQALDQALNDLQESYLPIVNSVDDVSASSLELLKQREHDCQFCLSRLSRSLLQLKTRIEQCDELRDTALTEAQQGAA